MMNGVILPLPPLDDNSVSNLTSASNEVSISSNLYHQQSLAEPSQLQQPPSKRRRSLPGNPDPDAEVVALSPSTLMTTNRFICEICNKGFQRDQNLQLHRRGHNLPWKLKQRTNKEPLKKKVYVCPEVTCVHHDPARALGDLTGIKKHFFRKHGEKKWKCEKCSKRYAVQSDWKAHSKICGTREYRCDCGTLFSRRDSFITHRAFCDALAEESTRLLNAGNTAVPGGSNVSSTAILRSHLNGSGDNNSFNVLPVPGASSTVTALDLDLDRPLMQLKREQQDLISPWISHQPLLPLPALSLPLVETDAQLGRGPGPPLMDLSSTQLFPARQMDHIQNQNQNQNSSFLRNHHHQYQQNPSFPSIFEHAPSPHMSATALLQKAAQMGVSHCLPEQSIHMGISTNTWSAGLGSTTLEPSNLFEEAIISNKVIINNPKLNTPNFQEPPIGAAAARGGNNGNEELTRDFLGLRAIPSASGGTGRSCFTNMKGNIGIQSPSTSTSPATLYHQQTQNNHHQTTPWQG